MSRRSNDWVFGSLKRIKQLKWLDWTKFLLNKQKQPFAIFIEKHLRWSLFLRKSQASVLKKFQYSQKNTCVGFSFNKVTDLKVCNCIKKRLQYRCFAINMAKFLIPAFFIEYLRSLILNTHSFLHDSPAIRSVILHFAPLRKELVFASFVEHFKAATLKGSHWQI